MSVLNGEILVCCKVDLGVQHRETVCRLDDKGRWLDARNFLLRPCEIINDASLVEWRYANLVCTLLPVILKRLGVWVGVDFAYAAIRTEHSHAHHQVEVVRLIQQVFRIVKI